MPSSVEPVVIAMDWGGTWARAAVADRSGQLLWSDRRPNVPGGTRRQLLDGAEDVLGKALEQYAGRPVEAIGVAAAGPIDTENGTFHNPPNLGVLDGVSLRPLWEQRFGLPVFVGNDANLAALGEYHFGAGRDARGMGHPVRTLVYITVSTGVGGGVIDHGRMLLGAEGMAAEVGHMVMDSSPNAPRCQCGNYGCLEALTSGLSIARLAQERLAAGESGSSLAGILPENLDAGGVFAAASAGDALASGIIDEVLHYLSLGLVNLLHLFNPDVIVLGGGVTDGIRDAGLLETIKERMAGRAMSPRHQDFSLVSTGLGYTGGMVGAAALAWQELGHAPGG